ncbi:hypothetical protein GGI1_02672 [Acidithiobacillus sp. GGI-221]|nr:hypothetical protein GGI1_02672 [Acidithiobacillus sp. GGI-221]
MMNLTELMHRCNYLSNTFCVVEGFHIGFLLLSGHRWYGPVIGVHVVRLTMRIVGEELVLGKNRDRLARMVLYTILAGALTVFFLNM